MTSSDLEQIDKYSRKHILRSNFLSEPEVLSSTLAMMPITGDFHLARKKSPANWGNTGT